MAASVMSYLGLVNQPKPSPPQFRPKKTPTRALPASWYTSEKMYELERRAIFSHRWLFITHRSRLQEKGDFLRYTVAGYQFVISLDNNNKINAFHNVCRHRAYPVVEAEQGRARIFACRYHGWSYGLNGKLAKAPNYQELEGFKKEENGLLPIHTHIDANGFIWINMDAGEKPEISWEDQFIDVDKQERFEQFNFDDYVLDHTYQLDGEYNWKILADNFNECYHCPTTHPDVPTFLNVDSADVETKDGHMQHDHASTPEQRSKGYNVNSTYYFPNASMSVSITYLPEHPAHSPHWMMIQKFLPDGATKATMSYEIYRNKNSAEADFKLISDTYARVMSEDKVLCDRAQRNLNAGVFVNGEMHPRCEKGPLFFQQSVREVISEHFQREKSAGHEIWPARQRLPDSAAISKEDMEICNGLACGDGGNALEW